MRILMVAAALLGVSHEVAAAEDFSGFYAGVNAGYARQAGDSERQGPGPFTGQSEMPAAETGLPPSARDAARALKAQGRSSSPTR